MPPPTPETRLRTRIFTLVTILVSVACLGWALHGVSWTDLWYEIRTLDWRWVAVGVVADVLAYIIQGWRWSLLLRPVGRASVPVASRAIFVGLFANEVLPLRAGELIRCFLLARWSEIPISVTLASALIERIFDGLTLMIGVFFSFRYLKQFPLSHGQARVLGIVADSSIFLAVLILVCGAVLSVAMYWREQALDAILDARIFGWAHVFIEDLHRIGHSRFLYLSALVSIPHLAMQVVPIYAVMQAYSLDEASWKGAAALMVLLRLGSAAPQAPGNVGLFQVLSTLGLTLFGVQAAMARRFTLILWGIVTLPLVIVGFIDVVVTGAKIGEMHREAQAEMRARQDELSRT
ncbi:MAG TPA: lysylphosphatidylglycerol synthase transmembrane domain-containing protein [Bryobacteraceae bacterium]|nr:lysylphosphatidylglycerol synthase transmembrane domain-containing protein [Bryobacteraceae bacterium]